MYAVGGRRFFSRTLGSATAVSSSSTGLRQRDQYLLFPQSAVPGKVAVHAIAGTTMTARAYASSTKNADGDPEITLERRGPTGGVAWLTLNKPERLNALSLSMIQGMSEAINDNFPTGDGKKPNARDDEMEYPNLLVLQGFGGKAFCAGGDVKAIYHDRSLGPGVGGTLRSDFFREEYRLDYRLAQLAKEKALLSLWDGVVMGGGVGISVHGSFRVATDTTLFAMPETGIGLFPDVGTSYVLSRLPGGLGQYLGLTGTRLRAADLLHCGLATHFIPREKLGGLQRAIVEDDGRNPAAVLGAFATEGFADQSHLAKDRRWIDEAFHGAQTVEEIIQRLEARLAGRVSLTSEHDRSAREWAQKVLTTLRKASPTSLKVTHRHIAWAADNDLRRCFEQDFRVMQHIMSASDFQEGVRALLVDKDNNPSWHPLTVEEVSESHVEPLFAGIGEHELDVALAR